MDSSVLPKDEMCFLRVCRHISTGPYFGRALKIYSGNNIGRCLSCACAKLDGAFPITSNYLQGTIFFISFFLFNLTPSTYLL